MEAIARSRTSLPRALTHARPATPVTVVIPLPAALPWLPRILPARWHCCGRPFPVCSIKSRQVATLWITPLSRSIRLHALPEARHLPTTSMVGVGSILQRPSGLRGRHRAFRPLLHQPLRRAALRQQLRQRRRQRRQLRQRRLVLLQRQQRQLPRRFLLAPPQLPAE